jgi:hypothetical protein
MVNPVLPRLLFSLAVAGIAVFGAWRAAQQDRPGDDRRYRPRGGKAWWRTARDKREEGPARVTADMLARSRDALSGAVLDPAQEIFRCADCQSYYTVASVRALADENGARCISCGGLERVPVEVVASR